MSDTINLTNLDSKVDSFINDQYISSSIILFIAFYTCMIAPKLPEQVVSVMKSQLFNLIILIIIVYVTTKNYVIGIVATIAYLVTLNTVQKYQLTNKISDDLLQDAINAGQINAQIITPTKKCIKPQLTPEQIMELRHEQVQQPVQQQVQQPVQPPTNQIQLIDHILNNRIENNTDQNINDRLNDRNFYVPNMTNQHTEVNITGNSSNLNHLDGLPLNL